MLRRVHSAPGLSFYENCSPLETHLRHFHSAPALLPSEVQSEVPEIEAAELSSTTSPAFDITDDPIFRETRRFQSAPVLLLSEVQLELSSATSPAFDITDNPIFRETHLRRSHSAPALLPSEVQSEVPEIEAAELSSTTSPAFDITDDPIFRETRGFHSAPVLFLSEVQSELSSATSPAFDITDNPIFRETYLRRSHSAPALLPPEVQSEVPEIEAAELSTSPTFDITDDPIFRETHLRRSHSAPALRPSEVQSEVPEIEAAELSSTTSHAFDITDNPIFLETHLRRSHSAPALLPSEVESKLSILRRSHSEPVAKKNVYSSPEVTRTREVESRLLIKPAVSRVPEIEEVESSIIPEDTTLRPSSSAPGSFLRETQSELSILRRSHSEPVAKKNVYSSPERTQKPDPKQNPKTEKTGRELKKYDKASLLICFLCTFAISYLNALPGQMLGLNTFLRKLSPNLLHRKYHAEVNNFCGFYDTTLLVVVAVSSLAQPIGVFATPWLRASAGLRKTLIGSLVWMLVGIILIVWLPNNVILFIGLSILNLGIGANMRVIPMIQLETSAGVCPYLIDFTYYFGSPTCIGITYLLSTYQWTWRVSYGGLGIFILLIIFLSFFIPNPPIQNKETIKSYFSLFSFSTRPYLIISSFSSLAGMFSIVAVLQFYSPLLFKSAGNSTQALYFPPILISIIQILSRIFTLIIIKRFGRRRLLLTATAIRLVVEGILTFGFYGLSKPYSYFSYPLVILIPGIFYVAADGCITAPSGWLKTSFPEPIKGQGTSYLIALGLLQNSITGSISVILFCKLSRSIFLPFICFDLFFILAFISYLVPETTKLDVNEVFQSHPIWARFVALPRV